MPISWRGTLAQYAGRLHRFHAAKREVVVFDHVDANEPLLAKIAAKREVGYRAIGYQVLDLKGLDRLLAFRRTEANESAFNPV
jgi:superfamily II DNA or RNA helicase